jgi:nucleotide-binding universal stress UspA family protein
MSSLEKEIPKCDYRRRTILLAYNPNCITKSQQLFEWAISNIIRPNLDHVYIFSVLHAQRTYYPVIDVWTFGLVGYANTYSNTTYNEDYQNYIKNEQECTRNTLKNLAGELTKRNVTSNIIISRGNAREELLKICESINPDMVLIGSSPSSSSTRKSKVRNLLNRSTLSYIRNNVKGIDVQSNVDNDKEFRIKSNKISEPKLSKQSKFG